MPNCKKLSQRDEGLGEVKVKGEGEGEERRSRSNR